MLPFILVSSDYYYVRLKSPIVDPRAQENWEHLRLRDVALKGSGGSTHFHWVEVGHPGSRLGPTLKYQQSLF
jgi:hypothetical protein